MTLTLQPTKKNDMVANNTYKVWENKHTTDKDKNKQVRSQIKTHLKNITKIEKYKKLNLIQWRSTKQAWALLENWAARLRRKTKQNTTTLWSIKQ